MSLLYRIARSKGDPQRRMVAVYLINTHLMRESGQPVRPTEIDRMVAYFRHIANCRRISSPDR